jgi:ketosteroid isomerase-like protein
VQPAEDGDEPDIRRRIEALAQAVCAMDIDAVRSIYAPDMVSFDIEPPLQHLGAKAKRATARFRRIGGSWRIAHDHVSLPLDVDNGKALLDLQP